MENKEPNQADNAIDPDAEYRVYTSSHGDVPVSRDVRGYALIYILGLVRQGNSRDVIYVREITERVVMVINPEQEIGNGFHFTS